ncbi:hypothetical protein Tsp_02042, partial [Trichinella spiralis]
MILYLTEKRKFILPYPKNTIPLKVILFYKLPAYNQFLVKNDFAENYTK